MTCCNRNDNQVADPNNKVFVPWQEAAELLPEHCGIIAEALRLIDAVSDREVSIAQRQAKDHLTQAKRVSKQKADEVLSRACSSWDNPFYIVAVGRGSPSGLRPDVVAGLLSLLVGTKPTSKHLAQAALLSIARIFVGSKDEIIGSRVLAVWMDHENSDVRDDAMLTLALLGNADVIAYAEIVRDMLQTTGSVGQASKLWHFCHEKALRPETKFDWNKIKRALTSGQGARSLDQNFALFRLRLMPTSELYKELDIKEMIQVLLDSVLKSRVSSRIAVLGALSILRCHCQLPLQIPKDSKEDLLNAVAELYATNVYREVREQAANYLRESDDPRVEVTELIQSLPEKIDRQKIKASMLEKYPGLEDSEKGLVNVLKSQYGGDILAYIRASQALAGGVWREAPGSKDYPGIVGLYFALVEIEEVPGEVISKLLAHRQYVERFMALVHVCVARRTAFNMQVAFMVADDPISTVRVCARKVAEHLGAVQATDTEAYLRKSYESLINSERQNVVLDLEFVTYCDDVKQVPEYLKMVIHGEDD
jgi:hypothetical protein